MRRIFPLVLTLLLVLRGLVGTAMAAGMVPALPTDSPAPPAPLVQQLHQTHQTHSSDSTAADAFGMALTADGGMGLQDQGMHTQCADPATGACDTSAHTHSPLCSACEICHSAVLLPPRPSTPPHSGAVEMRSGSSAWFASAAAALAIKPPIA